MDENGRFYGFSDFTEVVDVTSPKLQKHCSVAKAFSYENSKSMIHSVDDLNDMEF